MSKRGQKPRFKASHELFGWKIVLHSWWWQTESSAVCIVKCTHMPKPCLCDLQTAAMNEFQSRENRQRRSWSILVRDLAYSMWYVINAIIISTVKPSVQIPLAEQQEKQPHLICKNLLQLEGAQRVHISAKLKTGLIAHTHSQTDRQTDRQTDKNENSISASFTPFTWQI